MGSGHAVEFDAFVARSGPRLLRAAHLLAGDRHRGEDLLQDVLVRAYLRWSRITGDPGAYVRRALVNGQRNLWARRLSRESLRGVRPEHQAPGDVAADTARVDAVARALQARPARERAVVVLRYWTDLTEAQTAAELGLAVGTVKSTAHRALGKLRASPHLAVPDAREDLCRDHT